MKRAFALAMLMATAAFAQSARVASDFEIAQMQKQLAQSHDFNSQLSGHLNLGDVRMTRNEPALASAEYRTALTIATNERLAARRASNMERYAFATSYASLANAKLGRAADALELSDEALRYMSDSSKSWNLRANALTELRMPKKAESAARNAVTIAIAETAKAPTVANEIDLAIYRYALAIAIVNGPEKRESERLLGEIVSTLRGPKFDPLRKEIAQGESFQIYSTARGEADAYNSLLNRSQLLLASLYEERGDVSAARGVYRDVLASRSDDAEALAALARLASARDDRDRYFVEAFDANPFSIELIREFQKAKRSGSPDESTTGSRVRKALLEMQRGEHRAARTTLDSLVHDFPNNDVVQYLAAMNDAALGDADRARSRTIHLQELRSEVNRRIASAEEPPPAFLLRGATSATPTAKELRSLIGLFAQNRLTSEQRAMLDKLTLTNVAMFDAPAPGEPGTTVFAGGTIEGVPFTFSEPTAFKGTLVSPLRLTYRLLGVTQKDGADALLLEPLKVEAAR
jgi:tetratricopeptide (TPR) repeat protein